MCSGWDISNNINSCGLRDETVTEFLLEEIQESCSVLGISNITDCVSGEREETQLSLDETREICSVLDGSDFVFGKEFASGEAHPEPTSYERHSPNIILVEAAENHTEETVIMSLQENTGDEKENVAKEAESKRGKGRNISKASASNERKKSQYHRMRGKAYVGYSRKGNVFKFGYERRERKIGDPCISAFCKNSSKRNCEKFTLKQRQILFQKFWKQDWSEKNIYVSSLVTKEAKRTLTVTTTENRRNSSFKYFLMNGNEKLEVCKLMFLGTLGLKEWMVHNWINTSEDGLQKEKISRISKPRNDKLDVLKQWLLLLPKLPSHYCRKSSKVYLEGNFTHKNGIYKLYVDWCSKEGKDFLSNT